MTLNTLLVNVPGPLGLLHAVPIRTLSSIENATSNAIIPVIPTECDQKSAFQAILDGPADQLPAL